VLSLMIALQTVMISWHCCREKVPLTFVGCDNLPSRLVSAFLVLFF